MSYITLGVGTVLASSNGHRVVRRLGPGPMLGRMTSTLRWLILVPAGPAALLGGWLGEHFGLRIALGFAGCTALILSFVAWSLPIVRSITPLPTLKAEAVTPYSTD